MVKYFLIIFLLIADITFASCYNCHAINAGEAVVEHAKTYLYVREKTNNNDAPEIDFWLKNCNKPKGLPYCTAFVSNMYKEIYEKQNKKSPWPMTAGVALFAQYCYQRPFEFKTISTKKIQWGIDTVNPGDIISWKHGSSMFTGFNYLGHKGIGLGNKKGDIYTLEANTKAGAGGDQSGTVKGDMTYGHEGVYMRTRQLGLNTNFPIMFIIKPIKKEM